jgi:hypothetical protein
MRVLLGNFIGADLTVSAEDGDNNDLGVLTVPPGSHDIGLPDLNFISVRFNETQIAQYSLADYTNAVLFEIYVVRKNGVVTVSARETN